MKHILTLTFLNFVILFPSSNVMAEKIAQEKSKDNNILAMLSSEDIFERYEAITLINKNPSIISPPIIEKLLYLIEKEMNTHESSSIQEFQEDGYGWDLCTALIKSNDTRAIPYLIARFDFRVATFGESSVAPLIEKLHDNNRGFRSFAARTIGEYIQKKSENNTLKEETKVIFKKELIKELDHERNKDPSRDIERYKRKARGLATVRQFILKALGMIAALGDSDVILHIKKAAQKDSSYWDMSEKKNYSGPKRRYRVREKAQKILDELGVK